MTAVTVGIALGVWWMSNTVAHLFIHRPFFRRRAANRAFAAVLTLASGIPQAVWRDRHLAHHAAVAARLRGSADVVLHIGLVAALWTAMIAFAPSFFLSGYLPGYVAGLLLCALHGHYEHAGGTISHYGKLYNLLTFNDGFHVEHHAHPSLSWRRLPAARDPAARASAWPPPLRWLDSGLNVGLEVLERIVLRSHVLRRFVLRTHARALGALLDELPPVERIAIVGGGLFPRTALILRQLRPSARLTVIDANPANLVCARSWVGADTATFVNARYPGPDLGSDFDLAIIPLAFAGDRASLYAHPPAPALIVHDWLWRRRGASRIVSIALLKRVNLVKYPGCSDDGAGSAGYLPRRTLRTRRFFAKLTGFSSESSESPVVGLSLLGNAGPVPLQPDQPPSNMRSGLGCALMAVLLTAKAIALAGREATLSWWAPIAYVWQDAAVVLAFTALDAAVKFRSRQGSRTAGRAAFVSILYAAGSMYVVLNVPVTRVLATPMTWPMWRAARGPLADSIRRYATVDMMLLCALVAAIAIAGPIALRRVRRPALLATTIPLVALGPAATGRVDTHGLDRNAWTALVGSILPRAVSARPNGSWSPSGFERRAVDPPGFLRGAAAGRNILIVSLESAAAQYLGLYGADPDPMPHLAALARHGIVFDYAYALYPESIKGLYSLLCSASPALDSTTLRAAPPCASIAELLAGRGYRTALFHSGRFGYLGMNAVARNRGFEMLADAGDIGGVHESSFGVDEASTVVRILTWIDGLPRDSRFFVAYLPIAGHHPYDSPPGPFADRRDFDRYRNALHYADESLATLVEGLYARGLANRTVIIVLGDHGEAFGQHDGNYGHTFQVFEENVHVPLVLAAPGLIGQQMRSRQIVSLIDVAPTVLDLLGEPAPAAYEGQSLLQGTSRLAFFFTDYSRPVAGLRDGRFKAIEELDSGRTRLFDLDADPREQSDISGAHAERASWYAENLRTWSAAHMAR